MTTRRTGNYSFREPPFQDGDVIEGCNCTQVNPNTEICKGVKNLTIKGGNFNNCKPQPTWKIEGGNWCQVERCSHEHPEMVKHGLAVCAEDCKHRQGSEKQWLECDEAEYREAKLAKADVRTIDDKDADGVSIQRFEKLAFVYKDEVAMRGSAVKKALVAEKVKL